MSERENTRGAKRGSHIKKIWSKGKNYLLVIGIDEYEYCKNLNNAVKDAKDFLNLLHNK